MTLRGNSWLEADLGVAYRGPGSAVVRYGAVTSSGYLDDETQPEQDGNGMVVFVRRRTLRVPLADFPTTPTRDSTITVDGTDYQVRQALPAADGKELVLLLAV